MKINGKTVVGNEFAYEGCHKIYIIENEENRKQAIKFGYEVYPIDLLEETFENACSLRFISNWDMDIRYVNQFEENVEFIEKDGI